MVGGGPVVRTSRGWDGDGMAELSPLFVLLTVMRQRWDTGDFGGAVALAKLAAPYMHGRAATARPPGDLAEVLDEELDAWPGDGGTPLAANDPG